MGGLCIVASGLLLKGELISGEMSSVGDSPPAFGQSPFSLSNLDPLAQPLAQASMHSLSHSDTTV